MRQLPVIFWLGLAVCWGVAVGASPRPALAAGEGFGYLAFGDLRGHLEPCGCDPATDLGGLRRLAEIVQRERRSDAALPVLTPGNNLPTPAEGSMKTPFLLDGLAAIGVSAYALGTSELERLGEVEAWVGQRAKGAKAAPALPFVLSNAKAGSAPAKLARPLVEVGGLAVMAYTTGAGNEAFGPALAARWKTALAGVKGATKILLFTGSNAELAAIGRAKLFDQILSSNTEPPSALPGTAEKDDESRLSRKVDGMVVTMMPLGGQGVVRGGRLLFAEAKSVAELLAAPAGGSRVGQPGLGTLPQGKLVTWLDPATGGERQLEDLFKRYNDAAKAAFAKAGAAREKALATTPFAGAAACQSCHPSAYETWTGMAHAHALATLEAKGKSEDPECVACHVLGAAVDGGFVSKAASPQFANVQCENCHGPRKEHAADPTKHPSGIVAAKDACVGCHNAQHSPKFDFKTYWPRIAHGKG
jgi:hypothetical protein